LAAACNCRIALRTGIGKRASADGACEQRIETVELAVKFRPQCRRLILWQPTGDRIEAQLSQCRVALRRQYDERRVAHFINKLALCLFAEDIDLLPDRIFAGDAR
jgi:hypothetical protein